MLKLEHSQLVVLLLSISAMLILSRIVAEFAKKIKLPVVMGELLVGIVLGPTILGMVFPELFEYLFPRTGRVPIALDGIVSLSVIMLLFVA